MGVSIAFWAADPGHMQSQKVGQREGEGDGGWNELWFIRVHSVAVIKYFENHLCFSVLAHPRAFLVITWNMPGSFHHRVFALSSTSAWDALLQIFVGPTTSWHTHLSSSLRQQNPSWLPVSVATQHFMTSSSFSFSSQHLFHLVCWLSYLLVYPLSSLFKMYSSWE